MALETRRGYHPNNSMVDGMGGFLMSNQALEPVMEAAKDVAVIAKANTTRSADGKGIPMADRYSTKRGGVIVVGGNPRQFAVVENDAPHSAAVEFGNSRMEAQRPLRKAGGKVGELRGKPA